MPRISQFFGFTISMNFGDHDPPHFHATYGEFSAFFTIEPIQMLRGRLPG